VTDYATKAEAKAQFGKTLTDKDDVIDAMISAASICIDGFCNRPDGFVADTSASARVYAGTGEGWQRIEDCTEITLVAVKQSLTDTSYTSWDSSDWIAFTGEAKRPNFNLTPYTAIMCSALGDYSVFTDGTWGDLEMPTVQVTAKWGYATTVPAPIKQACITQVVRWLKRGESGWSDVLASAELGQLMYQKMLDPAVKLLLVGGRYVRPAV